MSPQHFTLPSDWRAHVKYAPAATCETFWMLTTVGPSGVTPAEPVPTWPSTLRPQQVTVPVAWRAHTWEAPTVTSTESGAVGTAVGACRDWPVVSTWPSELSPQQKTNWFEMLHVS